MDRWFIAVCQPGKDAIAERNLSLRNYWVYRPIMPGKRLDRYKQPRDVKLSMFPGYLFVLPHRAGWEQLRTTSGLVYGDNALLRINHTLASIGAEDPDFMEIAKTESRLWREHRGKPKLEFGPGDVVRIEKGPWVEFLATIENVDEPHRVGCLIDMLGRKVRAYVDSRHMSLATTAPVK